MMESFAEGDYSSIDDGNIPQGIRSTELEAVVNVVQAQTKKYRNDFDASISYMPSIQIIKTMSQKWCLSWGKLSIRSTPRQSGIICPETADSGEKTARITWHQACPQLAKHRDWNYCP